MNISEIGSKRVPHKLFNDSTLLQAFALKKQLGEKRELHEWETRNRTCAIIFKSYQRLARIFIFPWATLMHSLSIPDDSSLYT